MRYNKKDVPYFGLACGHSHSNCSDWYSHQKARLLLLCGTNPAKNHRRIQDHHQTLSIYRRNFHMVQNLYCLSEMSSIHSDRSALQPLPMLQNHNRGYMQSIDTIVGQTQASYSVVLEPETLNHWSQQK